MNHAVVQHRRVLATSPFRRLDLPPPTTDAYDVGGRVTHDRFGLGRIVAIDDLFLTVDFGDGQVRRLRPGSQGWQPL